jgi:hypothetical protein
MLVEWHVGAFDGLSVHGFSHTFEFGARKIYDPVNAMGSHLHFCLLCH